MSDEPHERAAIEALRKKHTEAVKKADVNTMAEFYLVDAVLMPPNDMTLYGRAEIREWFEEYLEHFRVTALADAQYEVTIVGDHAIERFDFMVSIVTVVEPGKRFRDDGRFLTIWQRQADGAWKIAQSIWNSQKPVGAGTTRFMVRMLQKNAAEKVSHR